MQLLFLINPYSRILHIEYQFFPLHLIAYTDTSLRSKLNRIVYKVRDYLMQTITVANEMVLRKIRIEHQRYSFAHFHFHRTDNILAQQIHIYISVSKIKRTGFNFREIQYVRN